MLGAPPPAHLHQHVSGVVDAHDQRAHARHVVDVGEGDEGDGRQVVKEHEQEVLEREGGRTVVIVISPFAERERERDRERQGERERDTQVVSLICVTA